MYYQIEYTKPTLIIKNVYEYKKRIREIVLGQLKELITPTRFMNVFFWLFSIFYIPFSLIYATLSLLEIIVDSILLPFSLVPIITYIPTIIRTLLWSLTLSIGVFSCVNLAYDLPVPIKFESKALKEERYINENNSINNFQQTNFSPPYFKNLFDQLTVYETYNINQYIDIIIYSVFKAELFAQVVILDSKISDKMKNNVLKEYQLFQALSLDSWFSDLKPMIANSSDIIESRFSYYQKTMELFKHDPKLIDFLAYSFYWLLDYGWEVDLDGKNTFNPQITKVVNSMDLQKTINKYMNLHKDIEEKVFAYFKNEFQFLFAFFTKTNTI